MKRIKQFIASSISTETMNKAGPFVMELFFMINDLWAALALPHSFAFYPRFYALIVNMAAHIERLQWIALIAAFFIAHGQALMVIRRCPFVSSFFRAAGLSLSGVLWVSIGISYSFDQVWSLGAVPFITMGIIAWGLVLRWPPQIKGTRK